MASKMVQLSFASNHLSAMVESEFSKTVSKLKCTNHQLWAPVVCYVVIHCSSPVFIGCACHPIICQFH
jgi:hypothetical protein